MGLWARPDQLAPEGDWRIWLLLAGRGFGKTRTGAEHIIDRVQTGAARRIALVAPTAGDGRDVMVEGDSGILACSPPSFRPRYFPSKRRVVWPNGAIATVYSAEEPKRLRGPQFDYAWCDEPAAWEYPEAWDQLMFGLRLGKDPRAVVTTTPRPIPLIRGWLARSANPADVRITRGSTFDNAANLPSAFLGQLLDVYRGTRLGRQELYAEVLDEVLGALWTRANIIEHRRPEAKGPFRRIVIAVDPAVTSEEDSDETGIVVVGLGADDRHAFVLEDLTGRFTPDGWARRAITAYQKWNADAIVAEVNNGGDLVQFTVDTVAQTMTRPDGGLGVIVRYKAVHASRGKTRRAEPIAALYEQGRVHHVGALGTLQQLEDELCTFDPITGKSTVTDQLTGQLKGVSPNRLDANVWGLTELIEFMRPVHDLGIRAFPTKFTPGDGGGEKTKLFQW